MARAGKTECELQWDKTSSLWEVLLFTNMADWGERSGNVYLFAARSDKRGRGDDEEKSENEVEDNDSDFDVENDPEFGSETDDSDEKSDGGDSQNKAPVVDADNVPCGCSRS